jgi:pimeloyl-ACP methyl ester carboxylesterase/plasmid stabilization system protein ParE
MEPKSYGSSLEIQRTVSLELGGSNDIANLFPEGLYTHPGYRIKDKLENTSASSAEASGVRLDMTSAGKGALVAPETRYTRSGDVNIAYQVVGDGPIDLVFIPGFVSHLEVTWEVAPIARFFERLAAFTRLILFDKRGTGMSDRVQANVAIEERIDDVRAVMHAAGSERATLFGISEGGPIAVVFAATHPERASALMLCGAVARFLADPPAYPWGRTREELVAFAEAIEQGWGTPAILPPFVPSATADPVLAEGILRYARMGASPRAASDQIRWWGEIDVRPILTSIRVPTLVLHRSDDPLVEAAAGRHLAELIPDARFVEVPGADHPPFVGDQAPIIEEIREFLTGAREPYESERVLTTVLFVDIVESTERAAALGDRRWSDLLDDCHAAVRRELARFRGREIDTAGDGFLASFDGPARAVRCAIAIRDALRVLGIEARAGLHTGEVEIRGEHIAGIAVHIGARVAAAAASGEVLASRTLVDLVAGSGIDFLDRKTTRLKGVPGDWHLFSVAS